ncbi:hypothetical protein EIP86_000617 [Pleurotus ostreatoroseus]|nr:hypothetical protein EIP86_000617 [Pleurotus ostreatoroseus]
MALISLAGADVMNSLANTLLLGQPTPQVREQAEAWVRKALAVIAAAKDQSKAEPDEAAHCDLVLAAALFNHGSLREMAGDLDNARKLFLDSRRQSSQLNLREGVIQADMAVRRVDRLNRAKESRTSTPVGIATDNK